MEMGNRQSVPPCQRTSDKLNRKPSQRKGANFRTITHNTIHPSHQRGPLQFRSICPENTALGLSIFTTPSLKQPCPVESIVPSVHYGWSEMLSLFLFSFFILNKVQFFFIIPQPILILNRQNSFAVSVFFKIRRSQRRVMQVRNSDQQIP